MEKKIQKSDYFPYRNGDPLPLLAACKRRVRFEEVDLLGMVWHGRYPSYLEDGRMAFGERYGMTYQNFMINNTVAPIVQMHLDYKRPLRFGEDFIIQTCLHWSEAARLNFSYRIETEAGDVAATASTVQLLTEPDGTMLLAPPEWLVGFRKKWQEGVWQE